MSLATSLRAGGIEVWLDTDELRGGDQWDQKIRRQIRDCALFMPLISATTQAREEGYFRREWKQAVERTQDLADDAAFLVPVIIDGIAEPEARVPDAFRRVQWTRLSGGAVPAEFVARVRALLASKGAPLDAARPPPASSPAMMPERPAPVASPASQRSPVLLGAIAVAVLAVGYAGWTQVKGTRSAAAVQATEQAGKAEPLAAPVTIGQSVAVLPFVNESSDKEQDYFADGLTEEMINLLGKVPDLRVAARSASFYYKGKNEKLATVAAELKVSHVLEGSVRKAGNRLRISAQLVQADNGYQLWSESYDRDAKDIFKMQDEISAAVVAALKLKLAAGDSHEKIRGTTNPEAYNQYLIGHHFVSQGTLEGYRRAVAALGKALALDPDYAQARAKRVIAEAYFAELTGNAAELRHAIADAETLVQQRPNDSASYRIRASVRMSWQWDWVGAKADMLKALALDPNDSDANFDSSIYYAAMGQFPEALAMAKRAGASDPLDLSVLGQLASIQIAMKNYSAADDTIARMTEIDPNSDFTLGALGPLRLLQGRAAEALAACRRMADPRFQAPCVAQAEYTLGHRAEAHSALDQMIRAAAGNAELIAGVYAWFGEPDAAFEWLEKGFQRRESGIAAVLGDRTLDSLHADPRWAAFLKKMNLSAESTR